LSIKVWNDTIKASSVSVEDLWSYSQRSSRFWTGLCPATPTNIPYIGKTKVNKLWFNTGHSTLVWTHGAGSGKSIAELINGKTRGPALLQFGAWFWRTCA
jgi:glycine/D-amino acid oxidase-like deaminating enzyme